MATISLSEWSKYRDLLSRISEKAADEFRDAVFKADGRFEGVGLGNIPRNELIEYAYGLATKYGEASSAVAAEMYDAIAELSGAMVPAAVPAETATYSEVAKTVNGIIKKTGNEDMLAQGIGRLVKMAGTDTVLSNAYRDRPKSKGKGKGSKRKHSGAQVAWIPSGDTCPFCLMLASKGWQNQTQWAANSHSEHIHANCDCTYAVRFNNDLTIEGYDPEEYKAIYDNAEGKTRNEKFNSMRRDYYSENKDKINAQKRAAYAMKKGNPNYSGVPKSWNNIGFQTTDMAIKGCNPNYNRDLPFYLWGSKEDYSNNCTNSVVAFEMRKRGYNVTACSVGENKKLRNNPFSAWKNGEPHTTEGSGLEDITKYMNQASEGTRIEITIRFPKTIFDNIPDGHAFVAEKVDNKLIFIDPQTEKIVDERVFTNVVSNGTMFMRIDDLEISDRGVSACKKVT